MAKNQTAKAASSPPIQFRPPPLLKTWLDKHSELWSVSKNELAKNLATAAIHQLDVRHTEHLVEVVRLSGGGSFEAACERVQRATLAANAERQKLGQLPMLATERQEFIEIHLRRLIRHLRGDFMLGGSLEAPLSMKGQSLTEDLSAEETVEVHIRYT